MNVAAVKSALTTFAKSHKLALGRLAGRQSQILELGAFVGTAQHFKAAGFTLAFHTVAGGRFRLKTGTRGHPSDYARVVCSRGESTYELHSNVSARGAHDGGVYCVDVGVVRPGAIPLSKQPGKWIAIGNGDLVSFVEVKRLVIYPMLLAQFLGIVHEIRPEFLRAPAPVGFGRDDVLPPALAALGGYSANSSDIVAGFAARGFTFVVAPLFDFRLARCRTSPNESPFFEPHDSITVDDLARHGGGCTTPVVNLASTSEADPVL
jgi:hypothetical protein